MASIMRTAKALTACVAISMVNGGCFFNADLPLSNAPPRCTNRSTIEKTLLYPEHTVCTLSVEDLNDTLVSVWTTPCSMAIADLPGGCDTSYRDSWPGSILVTERGYGPKKLQLSLDTSRMGVYTGMLFIGDVAGAVTALPYRVEKKLFDPFDSWPLSGSWWRSYSSNDSAHLQFDDYDKKLVFAFDRSSDTLRTSQATGIRTMFRLPSDFYASVDFRLRDEMDDAFEVGFFISTSPDTGRWDGERAGIFINGVGNGQIRFDCRSVNLQSFSDEKENFTAGKLALRRADSTVSCFLFGSTAPGDAASTLFFPENIPVYIHLKMVVKDQLRKRSCSWNNFVVSEGCIKF